MDNYITEEEVLAAIAAHPNEVQIHWADFPIWHDFSEKGRSYRIQVDLVQSLIERGILYKSPGSSLTVTRYLAMESIKL